MKVSELAKEFDKSSDDVLKMLKSLKLKAKNADQELSGAVVSVIKSQFGSGIKISSGKTGSVAEKSEKIEKPLKKAKKKETTTVKEAAKPKKSVKTKSTNSPVKNIKAEVKKSFETKGSEVKVKTKKVVSRPVRTTAAGAIVKKKKVIKKASKKKTIKSYPKISDAPVITLKPLARKRKKLAPPGKGEAKTPIVIEKSDDLNVLAPADIASKGGEQQEVPLESVKMVKRVESLPDIEIQVPITVKDLSVKLQQKPSVLLKHLMKMGALCHINQALDADVVSKIVQDFGFNLAKIQTQEERLIEFHKEEEEDEALLTPRSPVITFMGHVDHGKTTLLDWIRKSKVADDEHGGITQHMGAYSVHMSKGNITFLDTPGHEAFTAMRARGAHITDIVVLVIAADEGIMPQTLEAVDHARAANVPIVVALTKMDKKNADPDRVKKQLSEHDLVAEEWGGKTVVAGVSAITGEGVDQLLELVLLESELLELKANAQKKSSGIVVEAHLSHGKGVMATLIVQSGTLREGDMIV